MYFFIVSWFHEVGHYLSLKLIGVKSKISFNFKHFIVSYDNDKLKNKPKLSRLLVYCSGALASLVTITLMVITLDYMWLKIFLFMFFIIEVFIHLIKKEGDLRKAINLFISRKQLN